ncbi:hypothetical protein EW026_g6357 [Hermanssonia centrifuga]|uniref:Major facilitator superfamily (MFS) profile domain-containing protein n=1 Tax=Hermanssonia centrifuga TaxID=98765 RepID=A0A4S4KB77_9APHY|nr:hypothetical protein EW026_g6357 [Hermanssonia centrifuga]
MPNQGSVPPVPPFAAGEITETIRAAGKGTQFWLSFLAIITSIFLSALDLTAVATALPTITADLDGGEDFTWIGSAYSLSSTAFLPLSGALADIFGRKPIMMGSILLFAIGSALAGAAQNINMLIAARTIQGLGGGGIISLTEILTSDLVPLAERGLYQGMLALTWSFAAGIGPPIGGSIAEKASWRWLFYINLPLTGLALILVFFFLHVRTPVGSIKEKLALVDWVGNSIVISGSTLATVGLTFGGVRFPWDSAQVLAPLSIGLALLAAFIFYESRRSGEATIPWEVMGNRTTVGGYLGTFVHGVTSISIIYYLPVFFQACLGASPIRSGVDMLATALIIAPFALLAGIMVQIMRKYRAVNYLGWIITVVGFGLLSLLKENDAVGKWVGYQIIASVGTGMIFAVTMFPVLASLPVERTASALAFWAFVRAFAQTWGITISSTILQNELKKNLPLAFVSRFPQGVEIAYAAIPIINGLEEPLRGEVKEAFASSMSVIWKTMIGIAGIGLLTVLLLKEIPMKAFTDETYGLSQRKEQNDVEVGGELGLEAAAASEKDEKSTHSIQD